MLKKIVPVVKISKPKVKPKGKVLAKKKQEVKIQLLPGGKIRRDGLQLKKVVEQEEQEILAQEKVWETPAILRRKK